MSIDTKEKILASASELFAKSGFDGTSIREIASHAGVNIAAVNYHFTNKETLFWENFVQSIKGIEAQIRDNISPAQDPETVAWQVYLILRDNWQSLSNTFRLILSAKLPKGDSAYSEFCRDNFGPPGGEVLGESIMKSLQSEGILVVHDSLKWGVKSIFTNVVHFALLTETDYVKAFANPQEFGEEHLRTMISHHVQAILNFLKQSSK